MSNLHIEPIEESDFIEIDEIEKNTFSHPFPKTLYINDFVNNQFSEYFKLVLNDEIVGYFGIWIMYEDAQIITVSVAPNYQGLGYGTLIMQYIIDYVRSKEVKSITLEVRVSNLKAISLYKKFGFYKATMRKQYYENGEDAFLMKLDI